MEYMVWNTVPLGNACLLDPIRDAAPERNLLYGIRYGGAFPPAAYFPMSKRHRKATGLIDDVMNMDDVKVCAPRLVEFLRAKDLPNVEFLPVRILDHKGNVASSEYQIVHPVSPQPALDLHASGPTYSHMIKEQIVEVRALVVDPTRIAPGVRIFRLDAYFYPVLVERELASEIEAEGFRGPLFTPLGANLP